MTFQDARGLITADRERLTDDAALWRTRALTVLIAASWRHR